MAKELSFKKLPEDLLLRILFLTDIYTVLTISRVNPFFHTLASTKQLWLFLTKDLFLRGLIDIPSDEANLSLTGDELIAQVKRAVCGPRTWSPTLPTVPKLLQQFTIHLQHPASFSSLLPGGRYIVFQTQQGVECYTISTGHRVWSWGRPGFRVLVVDFSVCRGSRVIASLTVLTPDPWPMNTQLVIFEVDLELGNTREMLQFPPGHVERVPLKDPDPQSANGHLGYKLVINNTLGMWKKTYMPLFINLWTEQYVVLDCEVTSMEHLYIVRGYLLIVGAPSESLSVRLYSIPRLERLWRPLSDFNPKNVTPELLLAPITFPVGGDVDFQDNDGFREVDVSVTASLLRQNTYLLQVVDTVRFPQVPRKVMTKSTHRLDLSEQTPTCTLLSSFISSTDPVRKDPAMSRAGYSILPSPKEGVRLMRLDDGKKTFIDSGDAGRPLQVVLLHNGGLVVVHQTHVELLYYD